MATIEKKTGKRGSAYLVRYRDLSGKQRGKSFKAHADAKAFKLQIENELADGTHVAAADSITIAEAADIWVKVLQQQVRDGDIRPRTLALNSQRVENYIKPKLGHIKLSALTAAKVQSWLDEIIQAPRKNGPKSEAPRRRKTIGLMLSHLRQIVDEAQRRHLVGRNVVRESAQLLRVPGTQSPPRPCPDRDETGLILNAAATLKRLKGRNPDQVIHKAWERWREAQDTEWWKVFVHMAVFTGLRQGELRALRWEEVDLKEQVIKVRNNADDQRQLTRTKTEAGVRDVPIVPLLLPMLKQWKLACPPSKLGLVFPSGDGTIWHRNTINFLYWYPMMRHIGLWVDSDSYTGGHPQYVFHTLRHVAAGVFIEAGLQPKRIQKIMGHTSIQMTFDIYGHLFDAREKIAGQLAHLDLSVLASWGVRT